MTEAEIWLSKGGKSNPTHGEPYLNGSLKDCEEKVEVPRNRWGFLCDLSQTPPLLETMYNEYVVIKLVKDTDDLKAGFYLVPDITPAMLGSSRAA